MARRKTTKTARSSRKDAAPKRRTTTKKIQTQAAYFASMVRPTEDHQQDRNTKYLLGDLVKRYSKYVKVASLRNAQAVASLKLSVCRETRRDRRKVFRTNAISAKRMDWFARSGYVSKAVDNSADYEEINDRTHPAVALLSNVNPEMNGFELIESTQLLLGLTGNYFWFPVMGSQGYPTELWPMHPQFMDIIPSRTGIVEKYIWGRGTECQQEYEPKQIIPFRNPNPFGNPWWGVGDLYACITEADMSSAFSTTGLTMLDRGAQPGLIINAPGMAEGERRQLEAALSRKADGGRNAGRSLVMSLPKDATITNWEMGSKEAGLFAGTSEQRARDIIAACFDMPVGLLNMEEKSLANGKVVAPLWQLYGVAPRAKRIEDKINERLMPMFRKALGDDSLFVAFENPVQEDEERQSAIAVSLYTSGIWTKNEARLAVGSEPDMEDGDDYHPSAQEQPEPTNDKPQEVGGTNKPDDESKRFTVNINVPAIELKAQMPTPLAPPAVVAHAAAGVVSTCDCVDCDSTIKTLLAKPDGTKQLDSEDDGPPKALVATLAAELSAAYLRAAPSIISGLLTRPGESVTTIVEDSGLPTMLVSDVAAAARPLFKQGWERAFDGIQIPVPQVAGSFDITNEFARESFQNYTVRLSQSVTDTTARALTTAIEEGVAHGATVPQLTESVKQVMDDLSGYAAERIARTEASRAYTAGRIAQWKSSGIVTARKWRLSGNPCPMCRAAEQQFKSVPIDEPMVPKGGVFEWVDDKGVKKQTTMDFAAMQGGDAHPSCRCSIEAIFIPEVANA